LSYKNFGETSLKEIKVILDSKGLRLGMSVEESEQAPAEVFDAGDTSQSEDRGVLSHSVDDLQLSVRSRKCLQKLKIRTLGDLVHKTEAELLGVKNFGVTSLNETKKILSGFGLSLRTLD
jgi:DNA-directed RNA polymerase subunit alpha